MSLPRHMMLFAAIAVGALALIACGSSGKSSSDKTKTAAAGGPVATSPAGKTSTAATAQATTSGGSVPTGDLDAIAKKFSDSTFKADYKLTSTGTDNPLDGTMTMYKDGRDKFRFDVSSKQDGQDVSLAFFQTKDASAFCLDKAGELGSILGVDANSGVCFNNDSGDSTGGLKDLTDTFSQLASSDTEVLGKSNRNIIGKDTQCYNYRNKTSNETSETCFSSDGVPLYDKTDSGTDTTTVEATSVSGDVGGDVFKLPYEVKDFPSIDNP